MRIGYTVRASRSMLLHPMQGVERVRGRMDRHQDQREKEALQAPMAEVYGAVTDWAPPLHEVLGVGWPCAAATAFEPLWDGLVTGLTESGVHVGLASYGGWNDGDRAFAGAIWCLVDHLRPERVVETGVAHGLTSRIILQGLERNQAGRLWSIDLPAVDSALHEEIGIAVPQELRRRWSYVSGTSRERLPSLLDELGQVDLFVHDSLHTGRNTRFELDTAWPAIRPGGVAVVDDIDHSLAFRSFTAAIAPANSVAVHHVTGEGLWGVAIKPGG
jgi:Methyltransferase domain